MTGMPRSLEIRFRYQLSICFILLWTTTNAANTFTRKLVPELNSKYSTPKTAAQMQNQLAFATKKKYVHKCHTCSRETTTAVRTTRVSFSRVSSFYSILGPCFAVLLAGKEICRADRVVDPQLTLVVFTYGTSFCLEGPLEYHSCASFGGG